MRTFIVNIHEAELMPRPAAFAASGPAAERYEARMAPLGNLVGSRKRSASLAARESPWSTGKASEGRGWRNP